MTQSVSPNCALVRGAFVLLIVSACLGAHAAEMISLRPDADTCIREYNPLGAYGDSSVMIAGTTGPNSGSGRNRGFLRFPVTLIPSEAVVTAATLSLNVVRVPPIQADADFELRRVLIPWNESGSWQTPGEAWQWPGGVAGADFLEESSAAQFVPGLVDTYSFGPSDGLTKDVQSWIQNPASNFGWIFYPRQEDVDFTARQFASRESATPPLLQVSFVIPPKITQLETAGNQVKVHFQSRAGYSYRVEYRDQLGQGTWTTLASFAVQGSTGELIANDDLAGGTRFYRVVIP